MEKKLLRWKANGEKPTKEDLKKKKGLKGRLSFCVYDLDLQEKEQILEELKQNFGESFKVKRERAVIITGFVEGYYDEVMDKILQNGWEW
jgi:hypothetical protein